MNHETDSRLFEKYINGELDPAAEAQFEEHVKSCPDCKARYSGSMKIKRGLSSIADEPLPDGFTDAWMNRVLAYGTNHKSASKRVRRLIPAIAAGLALIAVISVAMISGVFMPQATMQEEGMVISESNVMTAEADQEEMEGMPAGQEDDALFSVKEGPDSVQDDQMAGSAPQAAQGDKAAMPLYVTPETFSALTELLVSDGAEFCLDENLLIISVTQENQAVLADFSNQYALGITPLAGEVYEVWVLE